jgi:phosphatidylserine decarboxylase
MTVHKEGYRIIFWSFVLIALILIMIILITGSGNIVPLSILAGVLLFLFIVSFFRSPKRTPFREEGTVVAPADGKIVIVKEVYEGEYLKTNCIQVSVFMSLLNVHVNWFPIEGIVKYYKYHPGNYLVAMHPKSSEKNERTSVVVEGRYGPVLFRQIAGLLARRIVCYAKEGTYVKAGEQTGFIKFGSRVDLFLPIDSRVQVTRGMRVKGSETIIARLPESEEKQYLHDKSEEESGPDIIEI